MADEKSFPMTFEGKKKIEDELNDLITNRRPEIVKRIKIARSFGDLSENSEYEAAKDEQSFNESRIKELENMLHHAVIIDSESIDKNELPDEEPETYKIVGAAEADPFNGKISNESPIAKGLIGHKLNEEVTLTTPGGEMTVKITAVE